MLKGAPSTPASAELDIYLRHPPTVGGRPVPVCSAKLLASFPFKDDETECLPPQDVWALGASAS